MRGLILPTATAYLLPLLMLFSIFLLLRGHNEPGGGFAGGLVAAAAFILLSVASGVEASRRTLRVDPRTLVGLGLLAMLTAGFITPLVSAQPYLTSTWWTVELIGIDVSFGTPTLFDIGVYLVVAGTVLLIAFSMEEE